MSLTKTALATILTLTCFGAMASNSFTCKAKIFNGGDVKVLLTGEVLTSERIENINLKLDGMEAFETMSLVSDKSYGLSRDRFNRFIVPVKALNKQVVDTYLAILLPKAIGNSRTFAAYLTLRPDGIKRNNLIACEFND